MRYGDDAPGDQELLFASLKHVLSLRFDSAQNGATYTMELSGLTKAVRDAVRHVANQLVETTEAYGGASFRIGTDLPRDVYIAVSFVGDRPTYGPSGQIVGADNEVICFHLIGPVQHGLPRSVRPTREAIRPPPSVPLAKATPLPSSHRASPGKRRKAGS